MATPDRPLSPHLQVYRWQWTMSLSILHRATGVALAVGAIGLVWWLLALAGSEASYAQFMDCARSPLGLFLASAFGVCLVYHFWNGIRHLLWDTTWGLDLPTAFRTGMAVIVLTVICGAAFVALLLKGAA